MANNSIEEQRPKSARGHKKKKSHSKTHTKAKSFALSTARKQTERALSLISDRIESTHDKSKKALSFIEAEIDKTKDKTKEFVERKFHLGFSGEIRLIIKYQPPSRLNKLDGKLEIQIPEARNLDAKDSNGLSDPYAKIYFNLKKYTTKIKKKNLNPVWNEECEFVIPHSLEDDTIAIEVYDWDRLKRDDFIGRNTISLADLEPGEEIDEWYHLSSTKAIREAMDSERSARRAKIRNQKVAVATAVPFPRLTGEELHQQRIALREAKRKSLRILEEKIINAGYSKCLPSKYYQIWRRSSGLSEWSNIRYIVIFISMLLMTVAEMFKRGW